MSSQAAKLKKLLKTIIQEMARNREQFTQSPGKDFTRKRKLDFASVVSILLSMSGGSTASSLMDYFKFDSATASTSAFVQQRAKLKPEAMEYLFRRFAQENPVTRTFHNYRLLAVDGSDLQIFADSNDTESYYPGSNGQRPYSLLHLNALYDLENQIYSDALIQKSLLMNEHKALTEMIDRSEIKLAILLADRGYEGYNNMAHLQEKGWNYLIRVKDGSRGIASGFDLPTADEFDLSVELLLTRRQTKDVKALCLANPNHYRYLPSNVTFDYLPTINRKHDPLSFYKLSFRIVRFRLSENSFETIVTNLPADTFPPTELKRLYARRWGIETSFRQLKYTLGLVYFHAKKVDHIYQEIFAKLTICTHINEGGHQHLADYSDAAEELESALQFLNEKFEALGVTFSADADSTLSIDIDEERLYSVANRNAGRKKKETAARYDEIMAYRETHSALETAEWLGLTKQTYYRRIKEMEQEQASADEE